MRPLVSVEYWTARGRKHVFYLDGYLDIYRDLEPHDVTLIRGLAPTRVRLVGEP